MRRHYRDESHRWLKGLDFEDTSVDQLFVKASARRPLTDKPPVWVLDLDSTLFCVGARIRTILFEFLRQHPKPELRWQQLLPRLTPAAQRYDIELTFREIFSQWDSERAADWARELWAEFREFWQGRFFSSRHMHVDEPYPGAVSFTERILAEGYEIAYLTGRDRPRTAQGTRDALVQAGFPFGERAHLVMKPTIDEGDLDFKRRIAGLLRSRFEVRVFLDNEPENIVMAAQEFPLAEIVFFHSVMSDRLPKKDFLQALNGRKPLRLASYLNE